MLKAFSVTLDVSNRLINNTFEVNNNDINTVHLLIQLKNENEPFDLTGKTIKLAVKKPDGTTVFQDGILTDPVNGLGEFILRRQAYLVPGKHEAELMISEGDSATLVTSKFNYSSTKAILNDETIESTNEFPALQSAIAAGEILKGVDVNMIARADVKVGNIQSQVDQLVIEGDSSVEAAQMRVDAEGVTHVTAKARADSDYRTINNINPSLNAVWKSPVMPAALRGVQVPSSYNPDVQLAALMDPLVDGQYVTKRSIGKSSSRPAPATTLPSEIFDVWCYEFTPKNPEKTILITALIHGNEYTAFHWCPQFADLLVNKYKGDSHLEYLRRSVRIVMVPIVNPYGHAVQTRENINGVDCSRNFDYNWGVSLDEYNQGPAPWSENESKIIRDLMASLPEDTVSSLDFHTTLSEGDTHYMIYYPRWMDSDVEDYFSLIDQIKKPGETTAYANVTLPTLTNWGVFKHGFNAVNPEFKNAVNGDQIRGSSEMTRAMKFFGNMVMLAAKKPFRNKGTNISKDECMRVNYDYRTDGGLITFGYNTEAGTGLPTYTSQGTKTSVRFEAKSEGTWRAVGDIVVVADQDCEVSIMSHLYQLGSPDFDLEKTKNNEKNSRILNIKAGMDTTFSIRSVILGHKTNILAPSNTNTAMRAREVVWQLRTKLGSAGTAKIKFIDIMIEFVPSTNGKRLTFYKTNPARIDYPTGQETVYKY